MLQVKLHVNVDAACIAAPCAETGAIFNAQYAMLNIPCSEKNACFFMRQVLNASYAGLKFNVYNAAGEASRKF